MTQLRHKESAKIVNQAITALGEGKKGLADRLNKDPSLISRYASGMVRPKAETLLMCMAFIQEKSSVTGEDGQLDKDDKMYRIVKDIVLGLSPNKDADLIHALFKVFKVAQKV